MNSKPCIMLLCAAVLANLALESAGVDGKKWKGRYAVDESLNGADGARPYDADGDGDLDYCCGWEESGKVRLYLNPGPTGSVRTYWPYIKCGRASSVEDAVMADMDEDGRVDVISASEGDESRKMNIHFAPSTGEYTNSDNWTTYSFPDSVVPTQRWMFAVPLDVNEDGHMDFVAGAKLEASTISTITWHEAPATNQRDLSTWKAHKLSNAGWTMSLVAHDMDSDGDLDIAVTDRQDDFGGKGVRWLENPGTNGAQTNLWVNHWVHKDPDASWRFMDIADIDQDSDMDLLVSVGGGSSVAVRWYERLDGSGTNWTMHTVNKPDGAGGGCKSVRLGDMNNDGQPDLALICSSAEDLIGVLWVEYTNHVTDSTWKDHKISGTTGIKYDLMQLDDLDGDGDLDALTCEENEGSGSEGLGVIWHDNPIRQPLIVNSYYDSVIPAVGANGYPCTTLVSCVASPYVDGTTQYVAIAWTGTGNVAPGTGTNTSFLLTNYSSITWIWGCTNYWLDVATSGDGGVDVGDGWYSKGSNLTLNVVASNGYHFLNWTGDVATTNNPLNLIMDQPYSVTANFAPDTCDITATSDADGNVSPSGVVQVPYGSGTNFAINPDLYYHVLNVDVNSVSVGATNNFTFVNVTSNQTIHATFAENLATNDTPQWWLAQHGLGTNDSDAVDDEDGDGSFNWEEYRAGTDPTNDLSVFAISNTDFSVGVEAVISWYSVSSKYYRLQKASNMITGDWSIVASNVPATEPLNTVTDDVTGVDVIFYRILLE